MAELDCSKPKRVFLWCVPRACSTAVTICLSYIDGMETWFEPYSTCFENYVLDNPEFKVDDPISTFNRDRNYNGIQPARKESPKKASSPVNDRRLFQYTWVKSQLELPERPGVKYTFVKDMTYAVDGLPSDQYLPSVPYQHTFLIRHPLAVITSFKRAVVKELGRSAVEDVDIMTNCPAYRPEMFFRQLYAKWEEVKRAERRCPVVIDADELIADPGTVLSHYCDSVGFPWNSKLLNWEPGTEITGKWKMCNEYFDFHRSNWYERAFRSTNFDVSTAQADLEDYGNDVLKCVDMSMPYYNAIKEAVRQ